MYASEPSAIPAVADAELFFSPASYRSVSSLVSCGENHASECSVLSEFDCEGESMHVHVCA